MTSEDEVCKPLFILYTNHRGDTSIRKIIPKEVFFHKTEWHPEFQWFMKAFDLNKEADRDFAMKDIKKVYSSKPTTCFRCEGVWGRVQNCHKCHGEGVI